MRPGNTAAEDAAWDAGYEAGKADARAEIIDTDDLREGPGRQVWEAGYVEGVKATWSDLSEPPPERAILFDLIAELRDTADVKPGATGRLLREMAGSAEARLREVGRS